MTNENNKQHQFKIEYVPIDSLIQAEYNPRKWPEESRKQLKDRIKNFDAIDPLIANCAPNRKNVLIGGNFRREILKELGYKEVPVIFVNIPDIEKEKELNLRLNRNTGEWDWELLGKFDASLLDLVGFSSEEIDEAFPTEENPEVFDLNKELQKIGITDITVKPKDVYKFGNLLKVMCGDSMDESDMLTLMDG